MTFTELPTINFDAYPGYDEFSYLQTVYSDEFKARTSICSQYGIVDTGYDPASAPFTAGRPLLVTVSPINPLTIDIAAGNAITPSFLLIEIDAVVPSVPLPSLTSGNTYIVALEYVLVSSPQTKINRFGDLVEVRLERPSNTPPGGGASTLINSITVANINDWNNPGIFPNDRKQNVVVIAIVNSQTDTTGALYLSVDLTRNSYSFNRPWFTTQDIQHRSYIGSGVITTTNPHGTSIQDLSSAGLTLYQQFKPRGGILAKDSTYYGYAGKICTESIAVSRWEIDLDGSVTSTPGQPPMGGRYYVRLVRMPIRTGSLYYAGQPWLPVPYTWIEGTRIVVLGALENPADYPTSLVMEYFTVDALEINAESPTQGLQTLEVTVPATGQEIIISAGLAISTLAQTSLSLPSLLGPIKRGYQVVCDGSGNLDLNPQPIVPSVQVSALVGATQTVNIAPLNGSAVYLTVGLTRAVERTTINATTHYDLNVQVQITGVDGNGLSQVEVLTFVGSQWQDQTSVNVEQPLQFLRTANKYQLVNSISLANTTSVPPNAGPEAVISLWADALSGTGNQEFATVASFFWTGTTGVHVQDERVIATSLDKLDQKQPRFPTQLPDDNFETVQELFSAILNPPLTNPATPAQRLMLELDDDRMWSESWEEFSTSFASGSIQLVDISFVTLGQTIRLAPGVYLTIGHRDPNTGVVAASGADTTIGEVNYSASSSIFVNNMIATINDPTWNSTWFAALGSGTNPPIVLTREDAYPEGFVLNYRQKIQFSAAFTSGDNFTVTINSIVIGPTLFDTSNNKTIDNIVKAINAASTLTGGVTAVVYSYGISGSIIMLNGNPNGDVFDCPQSGISGSPLGATYPTIPLPLTAFTLSQPINGILPTPHLPQRYPSVLTSWQYLSRAYLWQGVSLQGTIQVNGNDPTLIGNFDAIEIAPSKVIFARVGSGATADPTIGQFLVDSTSLANTFANLVATVNNVIFDSGVLAAVDGNMVTLTSAGMGLTTLQVLASTVSTTWILSEVNGIPQYIPQGSGNGNAFLKTLNPLESAEWRFMTVNDFASGWSPWLPLIPVSPSANSFVLTAPSMTSLYQIQLRLVGGVTNAFALYEYVPEVSGSTPQQLDTRLTVVEGIISDATASCASLDARISGVVDDSGVPLPNTEIVASHQSIILPDSATLKARLDAVDAQLYYASYGGITPHGVVTGMGLGLPPQLISGPVYQGNSSFISTVGTTVYVGGTPTYPLTAQINGYTYSYSRQIQFPFASGSPVAGTYYSYLEEDTPWGFQLATGTATVSAGDMQITDLTANFPSATVQAGHLLLLPGILVNGQPLTMHITAVTTQTLTLSGRIPSSLVSTSYSVYNPREGIISYTGTKLVGNSRLYLGEITWDGSSSLSVLNYRYLNKYTSPLLWVDATGGSYQTSAPYFSHNLGFIPSAFTLYFYNGTYNVTPTSIPKVLHIGDECVVQTDAYLMTVRNRYANLVARGFDGTAYANGYIQLVI